MSVMKVGILNVEWLNNMGSVLLAYAVQKKLDQMGIDNDVIHFLPHELNAAGEIPSAHKEEKSSSRQKIEHFNRFRKEHLRLTKTYIGISEVGELDYDAYILGADTVWTPLRVHDTEAYMYYFEFCKDKSARKISWAASMGTESREDLDMMAPVLRERLRNFNYISVRERDTIGYIQSLTDKKVVHAIDPVLMLHHDDYKELLPAEIHPSGRYIYVYLFDHVDGGYTTANRLSSHLGLPIVGDVKDISRIDHLQLNSDDDGPIEMMGRICHADYVITDSFHVMIFAILYRKPFIAYSRMNTGIRLRNLLEDLDLSSRFLLSTQEGFDEILKPIDYASVFLKIDEWRESTMSFLVDAFRGNS